MSKGSDRRKPQIPASEVRDNWDRIFSKQENKESKKFNQPTE